MTDDSLEQPESSRETQEASAEAKERLMRLHAWLNGLFAGGPSLAEAVKPWREGLPIYGRTAGTFAEDQSEVPEDGVRLAEESLMAACRRIREGLEQAGEPPLDICEEEPRRRLIEVLEEISRPPRRRGIYANARGVRCPLHRRSNRFGGLSFSEASNSDTLMDGRLGCYMSLPRQG
jgi:hypothetical protein